MNPFAWVLIDPNGDAYDVLPHTEGRGRVDVRTLEDAWRIFRERLDFQSIDEMRELGYRVLRVRLFEVGPA